MEMNKLIGMGENEAEGYLISKKYIIRVWERDGEEYISTADFRTDRVNVKVKDGVVISAEIG